MFLIENLKVIATLEAKAHGINPALICAIITVESHWSPYVALYEKNYKWLYKTKHFAKLHGISEETEIQLQSFSWGLLQIMGASARDVGYNSWLPLLCEPEVGLYWGCKFFSKRCAQYKDVRDQIACWNGGAPRREANGLYENQSYVDSVMGEMKFQ